MWGSFQVLLSAPVLAIPRWSKIKKVDMTLTKTFIISKVTEVGLRDADFVISDIILSTICHIGPHFLVVLPQQSAPSALLHFLLRIKILIEVPP